MIRLESVAVVWENPEGAYKNHLERGGKLTRQEFIEKIAFIKDGTFNSGLLYGLLGSEVASYTIKEHEEMDTLKNVIAAVANYLLSDRVEAINDLSRIVEMSLKQTIMQEISEESKFSFEDCYLLKNVSGSPNLEKLLQSGIFDTAVIYENNELKTFPLKVQHNNYFYAADKRDLGVFMALYEAGMFTQNAFFDNVFQYCNANYSRMENQRGFAFVDNSLITKNGDMIIFAGKEYNVKNGKINLINEVKFVEVEIEGAFQQEHIIFCGV